MDNHILPDILPYHEQVAKELIDSVYSKIEAKIGIHLSIYESRARSDKTASKYILSQAKRYRHLLNHVSFLRSNRAYWRDVAAVLSRRFPYVD